MESAKVAGIGLTLDTRGDTIKHLGVFPFPDLTTLSPLRNGAIAPMPEVTCKGLIYRKLQYRPEPLRDSVATG